jgi:hypothetical protein
MTSPLIQAREAISEISQYVQSVGLQNLAPEIIQQLTDTLNRATETITRFREERPQNVDQLYLLAGGNPEAFQSYLRNYPDARTNALGQSPLALHDAEENLKSRFGEGINLQADGIPHGPLMSSNIYGFQYDPDSGKLRVRFNEGGVYEYGSVPPDIYQAFEAGAIPAKTEGENQWGKWWRGKEPSAGSSFFELIKMGGFPYKKLK